MNQSRNRLPALSRFYLVFVWWLGFAIGWVAPTIAHADFVLYRPPGAKGYLILEGKVKQLGNDLIEYTHPAFGSLALSTANAVLVKAPTRQEEFRRLWNNANKTKSTSDYLEAARQALKRGLLKDFYECCGAAYKIDPKNETLIRLIQARKLVRAPLEDSGESEKRLKEIAARPNMKIATSAHYVLLHDTSDAKIGRKRQTRSATRLELLETVYEAYFMKFALEGVVLQPPKERMMVLLFAEEADYLRYATLLNPALKNAAGFWSPNDNVSVFFDQGTTRSMKQLASLAEELQKIKTKVRGTAGAREVAHLANAVDLIAKISREESDIEVVSHEATHQLAGNTGLMPRGKISLRWAHEGLASYFETTSGAGWGGIGAVNDERLADYKAVARDPVRRDMRVLVCDLLFDGARNQVDAVQAYGQAWALTHFLMETRFNDLVKYYQRTSELNIDEKGIPREQLVRIFEESFGKIELLQPKWDHYMSSLQSDIDRIQAKLK